MSIKYTAVVNDDAEYINLFADILIDNKCMRRFTYSVSYTSIIKLYNLTNVIEIIKSHKLLNYVIKNKKCAEAYQLTKSEIEILEEFINDDKRG